MSRGGLGVLSCVAPMFRGVPMSVMAGHAVERRLGTTRRVLVTMAVDAPPHGERRRRRPHAGEMQQVVHEPRAGGGADRRHRLHGPVTRLAADARAYVGL